MYSVPKRMGTPRPVADSESWRSESTTLCLPTMTPSTSEPSFVRRWGVNLPAPSVSATALGPTVPVSGTNSMWTLWPGWPLMVSVPSTCASS